MSDTTVQFNNGTKQQVAMDLAKYIRLHCSGDYKSEKGLLTLYHKCLRATSGYELEDIFDVGDGN